MNKTAEKLRITVCLALMLVTAAVYLQVGTHDFLTYDDHSFVCDNPHVYTGLSTANFVWAFTSLNGDTAYYQPLTWLSLQVDCQLFGLRPGPIHLTNLWFHLANTVLLFLLLETMTRRIWCSAMVAALFALHPLHIETVAWIAERKSLVCTFFWLLTTLAYVWYVRRPGLIRYALVCLLYTASLLSKPLSVTLPFTLLLLDYWPLNRVVAWPTGKDGATEVNLCRHALRSLLRLGLEKVPLLLLAAGASVVAVVAQEDLGAVSTLKDAPFGWRISNGLVSALLYLRRLFLPTDLSIIYGFPPKGAWWLAVGSGAFLLAASVLAVRLARNQPHLFVGWFWYLGTLVPMIGLVKVGGAAMADRYTYVTLIGVFVALVWVTAEAIIRLRAAPHFVIWSVSAVLAAVALWTSVQLGYWKNSVRVFEHAAASDESFMARFQLALAYASQTNLVQAEQQFEQCIDKAPGFHEAHTGLGGVFLGRGDPEKALHEYSLALSLKPDDADVHGALARLYANCRDPKFRDLAKAETHARRACEVGRHGSRANLLLLAGVYLERERFDEAVELAARLIRSAASAREAQEARNLVEAAAKARHAPV